MNRLFMYGGADEQAIYDEMLMLELGMFWGCSDSYCY